MKSSAIPVKEQIKYFSFLARALRVGFSIQDAHSRYRPAEKYKKIFSSMGAMIRKGFSFASALQKVKFSNSDIVLIIKAGEDSSKLLESIEKAKTFLQESLKTKKELVKMLTMPAIELTFGILALNFALLVILPKMKKVVAQFGSMPSLSEFLFSVADFYKEHFSFFLIAFVLLLFLAYKGRDNIYAVLFQASFFRSFYQYYFAKNFFFQLELYLSSGMSLAYALKSFEKNAKGGMEKRFITQLLRNIQKGMPFDDALRKTQVKLVPDDVVDMVAVTKHTGNYLETINEIVTFSSEEYKARLTRLTSLLEPFVIFSLAVLVFILIISVYYPIFTMGSKLQN